LDPSGKAAAGDDEAATCQCSGRLTKQDTCANTDADDYEAKEPLCGTGGKCGACDPNPEGNGRDGTDTDEIGGTKGSCQKDDTFCCEDGSCMAAGECPKNE